ncbi:MAG: hypothetical protein PHS60_16965, partial [Zavarzinia sp.]|nr:hypothetical protein [Zavarzinia sp.]
MRTAGIFNAAIAGLGLALTATAGSGALRAEESSIDATGPLVIEAPAPEIPPPAAPTVAAPTVATALPAPVPALPAAADTGESDEPLTTGIDEEAPPAPATIAPAPTPAVAEPAETAATVDLATALGFDPNHAALQGIDSPAVERFYTMTGRHPLWTADGALAATAPAVLALIGDAGAEGLDPARYPLGLIAALRGEGAAGAYEVLLSDTLIRYVADRNG